MKHLALVFLLSLFIGGCGDVSLGMDDSASEDSSEVGTDSDFESGNNGSDLGGDDTPIQAGTLTSGDLDDALNPSIYLSYITEILQNYSEFSDLPFVDAANRFQLSVTDTDGEPLQGAHITITFGESTRTYITPSTGYIYVYPTFDRIDNEIAISANYRGLTTQTSVLIDEMQSSIIDLQIDTYIEPVTKLDLMLVLDVTGSMGDELNYLKVELASTLNELSVALGGIDLTLGIVLYKDIGDDFVIKTFDLSSDINGVIADLDNQGYGGGGDYPEAMDAGIEAAINQQWRSDSVKMMLLVADAPPHDENMIRTWELGLTARQQQIHIIPVAASGVALKAEYVMRGLALMTHSRYIFLTDDSNVGNSHGEPSTDCYIVTRLDTNIRRVIQSLFTGERVEPSTDEIIRVKGNYNNGVCNGAN